MAYQKILVPLDGSELSERALYHAQQIASSQTKLYLLSVIEEDRGFEFAQAGSLLGSVAGAPSDSVDYTRDMYNPIEVRNRERYVQGFVDKLQENGSQAHSVVLCGSPAKLILDVAQDIQADLIVMASHGRTGVNKLLIGSVAERVLHGSPCPILIVRGRHSSPTQPGAV